MSLPPDSQFVDAEQLRQMLWHKNCRPTLRTIRAWQTARIIPSTRIGRRVYFDPPAVKLALATRNTVRAK